jgi:hypothetical protein
MVIIEAREEGRIISKSHTKKAGFSDMSQKSECTSGISGSR